MDDAILDPLSSIFYMVYYISGWVALSWAGVPHQYWRQNPIEWHSPERESV